MFNWRVIEKKKINVSRVMIHLYSDPNMGVHKINVLLQYLNICSK